MSNSVIPGRTEAPSPIPGWAVWQSPRGRQWHARKIGASPPLLIHDDTLEGLRGQARRW